MTDEEREALEKAKKEKVEKGNEFTEKANNAKVSGSLGDNNKPTVTESPKTGDDKIEKSKNPTDSMSLFFDALTGGGKFEGDKRGVFDRLTTAFSKADGITKLLTGAGITAAVMSVINSMSEEDDDDNDKKLVKSLKKAKTSLDNKIKKHQQTSHTLSAKIANAMQNKNIADNLAGSGFFIKSLAEISIKTQESLSAISDFIHSSNLTLVKSISDLKDSIDEIESNNGSAFEGLFPLLIAGIMTAFGAFFLGSGGKTGIIDTIVDSIWNKFKTDLGVKNGGSLIDKILEKIIGLDNIQKIKEKISELIESINSDNIKKLLNALSDQKILDSISSILKNFDENNISKFFDNISSIAKSTKSINSSIETMVAALGEFIPSVRKLLHGSSDADNPEDNSEDKSLLDKAVDWGKDKWNKLNKVSTAINIAPKLEELSKTLKEISSSFAPLLKFIGIIIDEKKRKGFIEEFTSDFKNSFIDTVKTITDTVKDSINTVKGLLTDLTLVINRLPKEVQEFLYSKEAQGFAKSIILSKTIKTNTEALKYFNEHKDLFEKAKNLQIPKLLTRDKEDTTKQDSDNTSEITQKLEELGKKIDDGVKSINNNIDSSALLSYSGFNNIRDGLEASTASIVSAKASTISTQEIKPFKFSDWGESAVDTTSVNI